MTDSLETAIDRQRRYRAEAAEWHLARRAPVGRRAGQALRAARDRLRRTGPDEAPAPPEIRPATPPARLTIS